MRENNQEQAVGIVRKPEIMKAELDTIPETSELVNHPLQTITRSILVTYDPKPMMPPMVVEDFHELSQVEKVAETIRYCSAKALYSMSPGGGLQAFWKLLFLGVLILFPVLSVGYGVAAGLVLIFYQTQLASESLVVIAFNALNVMVCVLKTTVCLAMVYAIIAVAARALKKPKRR